MVLSTDNEFHFEVLGKLTQALGVIDKAATAVTVGSLASPQAASPPPDNQQKTRLLSTPKGQLLTLQVALHAADVSNVRVKMCFLCTTLRLLALLFFSFVLVLVCRVASPPRSSTTT